MSTRTLHTDDLCPFCLLAEQVLSGAIGDWDISISWRAFELRLEPVPTLLMEDRYLPPSGTTPFIPRQTTGSSIPLPSIEDRSSPGTRFTRSYVSSQAHHSRKEIQ